MVPCCRFQWDKELAEAVLGEDADELGGVITGQQVRVLHICLVELLTRACLPPMFIFWRDILERCSGMKYIFKGFVCGVCRCGSKRMSPPAASW